MHSLLYSVTLAGLMAFQAPNSDILISNFEGMDYGAWTVTGTAFGPGPAQGTLKGQMDVSGFIGHGLVSSYYEGDGSTGTLTSPDFKIERKYINFLIGGGKNLTDTCMNLLVEGKVLRVATGPNDKPGGSERLDWGSWEVSDLIGKTARIVIVDKATGGWGHINIDQIYMSVEKAREDVDVAILYNETYRPQFHFTAQTNWLNDPNGLVYYKGDYHLFFQHNPGGIDWGNMTWGHAVSKDLVHWVQGKNALLPDALGTIFSGSAVVDKDNTAGFQSGKEKTLVAIYTAAGDSSPESKGVPFSQCIAYSNDRGVTWTKYAQNPVLKHIAGGNRDPKVVWHAPTKRWIMALYLDKEDYAFFSSPDLKSWTHLQDITVPGCGECPDFFQIPIQGQRDATKWVWTAANGRYLIGDFDGAKYTSEGTPKQVDFGGNYYAVQTYSDIPASDGRRIQIAWMAGGSFPQMPFNQQMSFPCEMTLRNTEDGLRIFRYPVKEIKTLYANEQSWNGRTLKPGDNLLAGITGDLFDIEALFELKSATAFGIRTRGADTFYNVAEKTLISLGHKALLSPENRRIKIRLLLDRTSVEAFGNDGRVSLTTCFMPRQKERSLGVYAEGGDVKVVSLKVRTLKSAWPAQR